jgi:hypothetical protein
MLARVGAEANVPLLIITTLEKQAVLLTQTLKQL